MINFDFAMLQKSIHTIIHQIHKDQWLPDYVVGVEPNGTVPAVFIANYLGVPMNGLHIDLSDNTLDSLRGFSSSQTESNCWMAEDAAGYKMDRPVNILIVVNRNDDAVIDWLRNDWESSIPNGVDWSKIWNHSVRFASLVDVLTNGNPATYSAIELETLNTVNFIENNWWEK